MKVFTVRKLKYEEYAEYLEYGEGEYGGPLCTCCDGGWIKHWENNSGEKADSCSNVACKSPKNSRIVWTYVRKIIREGWFFDQIEDGFYIVTLCASCYSLCEGYHSSAIDRNLKSTFYRTFNIEGTKLISPAKTAKCKLAPVVKYDPIMLDVSINNKFITIGNTRIKLSNIREYSSDNGLLTLTLHQGSDHRYYEANGYDTRKAVELLDSHFGKLE